MRKSDNKEKNKQRPNAAHRSISENVIVEKQHKNNKDEVTGTYTETKKKSPSRPETGIKLELTEYMGNLLVHSKKGVDIRCMVTGNNP